MFDLRSRPEVEAGLSSEAFNGGGEGGDGGEGEEGDDGLLLKRVWVPVFEDEVFVPERLAVRYRAYARKGLEVSLGLLSFFLSFFLFCTGG